MSGSSRRPIVLSDLPNPDLVKSLYQRYYVERAKSAGEGVDLISSFWKDRSSKFDVSIQNNRFLSLTSVGMGLTMSTSRLQKILGLLCAVSYLVRLPQWRAIVKMIPRAYRIVNRMGGTFSFNCFKDVCALEMIMRHLGAIEMSDRLKFLMIGDGYGFFSSLVKTVFPDSTITLVDIGKTLLFQAVYCQKVHGGFVHRGIYEMKAGDPADFAYCPTEELEKLNNLGRWFDIATNVGSMQEMNYVSIERYFSFLRRRCRPANLFYCCNREVKRLIGGEISEFKKYPWLSNDRHLVDEVCPWYGYQLLSRRSRKLFGLVVPRVKYYRPILHRLTVLSTERIVSF